MSSPLVPHLILEAAARQAASPALAGPAAGELGRLTFARLREEVENLALALTRLGVGRGDRVGLIAANRPEWALCDLAIQCAGAASLPLSLLFESADLGRLLAETGARFVIAENQAASQRVMGAARQAGLTPTMVVMDPPAGPSGDSAGEPLASLLELGRRAGDSDRRVLAERLAGLRPDDLAAIVPTSGASGAPRAVALSHGNLAFQVAALLATLPYQAGDRLLSLLPLVHVLERTAGLWAPLARGASIVYPAAGADTGAALREVRPTVVVAAPRVFERAYDQIHDQLRSHDERRRRLLEWALGTGRKVAGRRASWRYRLADRLVLGRIRNSFGGEVRFCLAAGAPLDRAVAEFFANVGIPLYEGYALAEHAGLATVNRPGEERIGTAGRPLAGVEIRLAADGEIMVRSPAAMKGYWEGEAGRPAPQGSLTGDGWLLTGDLGEISPDGFLRVVDCKRDAVSTAFGRDVGPAPIENLVRAHRLVSQAVLIGDRRHYPTMVLVPDFEVLDRWAAQRGIEWRAREDLVRDIRVLDRYHRLVGHLAASFPRYARPRRFILLTRELSADQGELTPAGRVRRRILVAHFHQAIEEMYS